MSLPVLLITFRGNMGKEHLSHTHKKQRKNALLFGDDSRLHNWWQSPSEDWWLLDSILEFLPESMGGESATPAGNHLLTMNPDSSLLSTPESESFHHYVAKLIIYASQPGLIYRLPSPSWAQGENSRWDDLNKLSQIVKYLQTTRDLPLTLEAEVQV